MIKDRDIVCISPIDWNFLRQRHQIFMEILAKSGNRVFYIENINPTPSLGPSFLLKALKRIGKIFLKKTSLKNAIPSNLTIITPFVIPFRDPVSEFINKKILLKLLCRHIRLKLSKKPIVWTYLATSHSLELINNLQPSLLIYDCVFDASLHPSSPRDIVISETKVIKASDIIFTDNSYLFEKCKKINPVTYNIPPGVSIEFIEALESGEDISLPEKIQRPMICFFGGIEAMRIDIDLIVYIADKKPDWSVVLFGPAIKTDLSVFRKKNIFLMGTLAHNVLPLYLRKMDAFILPYKITPFTRSIFPAKIFECLASGKPIVATPLEELKFIESGLIEIAGTNEAFVEALESVIKNDPKDRKDRRLKLAIENSWDKRFEKMQRLISEILEKKAL